MFKLSEYTYSVSVFNVYVVDYLISQELCKISLEYELHGSSTGTAKSIVSVLLTCELSTVPVATDRVVMSTPPPLRDLQYYGLP